MEAWNRQTRIELKRELQRQQHYTGPLSEAWDAAARRAVETFRTASR
jgi:hypothetical protein